MEMNGGIYISRFLNIIQMRKCFDSFEKQEGYFTIWIILIDYNLWKWHPFNAGKGTLNKSEDDI